MRYIVPTAITQDMLVSSSAPETDHAAWAGGTAYAVGDRVIRTSTHSIYERLVAGTSATAPEDDPINWVRVGPTNRWAAFDQAVGTRTSAADTLTFSIQPGVVRGLALLDLDIESATVVMTVDGETVYSREILPQQTQEDADSWYDFFFEAVQRRSAIVLTDLPPYGEGVITVTLSGGGSPVSVGTCAVGPMYELGTVLANPRIGILDYSKKTTDDFGTTSVTERGYAKRMTLDVLLPTTSVDLATIRLARVRARPAVWVASPRFDALSIYGWLKDWSVSIPGLINSTCSLEIEGLI